MPNTTHTAPVACLDMAVEGYVIWPCSTCRPWHLEVISDGGGVFAREWHAVDCPRFQGVIATLDANRRREKEAVGGR